MIYESFFFSMLRSLMSALPFVLWQITFLLLLFFVTYKNKFSWKAMSLLLMVSMMVALGYYEKKQQWLEISNDTVEMYLGPGYSYPRNGSLSAKDKVRVCKVRENWKQIEHNGGIGWIQNAQC